MPAQRWSTQQATILHRGSPRTGFNQFSSGFLHLVALPTNDTFTCMSFSCDWLRKISLGAALPAVYSFHTRYQFHPDHRDQSSNDFLLATSKIATASFLPCTRCSSVSHTCEIRLSATSSYDLSSLSGQFCPNHVTWRPIRTSSTVEVLPVCRCCHH